MRETARRPVVWTARRLARRKYLGWPPHFVGHIPFLVQNTHLGYLLAEITNKSHRNGTFLHSTKWWATHFCVIAHSPKGCVAQRSWAHIHEPTRGVTSRPAKRAEQRGPRNPKGFVADQLSTAQRSHPPPKWGWLRWAGEGEALRPAGPMGREVGPAQTKHKTTTPKMGWFCVLWAGSVVRGPTKLGRGSRPLGP